MAIDINVPSQVKTYANLAAFPATGSLKTIFIAEDTNKTYRWTGSVYVEVSAAGATGITIGTTAITSGTVGRVLFEGTGNVVQESANLFWDNTNGRLGIGGTPGAFALDVTGSARVNALRFQLSTNAQIAIAYSPFPTTRTFFDYEYEFLFRNVSLSSVVAFMIHRTTNNIGINTTTDAGFKLDVNGTARVSGQTTIKGTTNNDTTNIFRIEQQNGNGRFLVSAAGQTQIVGDSFQSSESFVRLERNAFNPTSGGASHTSLLIVPTINQTGGAFGITRGLYIAPTLTSAFDFRAIEVASGGAYINTTSVNASAILQADSTTKGFLCPRMTTTQKNAIATPATGLMVYDTTLNLISVYNGTTWISL